MPQHKKIKNGFCKFIAEANWYSLTKKVLLFSEVKIKKLMKVIRDLKNFTSSKNTAVTIGTFDGVHIGHQKILTKLVEESKKRGVDSVVVTFFPHPRMVLQKEQTVKMIDTLDEKIEWLDSLGIDTLVVHPFSKEFSRTTALTFARDIVASQLQCELVIIGYDHRFGQNREATIEDLEEYGHLYGFEVAVIPVQDIESIAVSSTKIRNALQQGQLPIANQYLNRPFRLTGQVIEGDKIGHTIDFPTANIHIEEAYKLWPPNGVYLVNSQIDNQEYWGMMNIGNRPTVSGSTTRIEVHFFELNQDLYHQKLSLNIYLKIREERKFDSLPKLKEQLTKDQALCQQTIPQITEGTATFTKK